MKEAWVMVRVRKATRARLSNLIDRLKIAADQGKLDAPNRHTHDWTLDDAIVVLLDRDEAHRARVARSKAKQRAGNGGELPAENGGDVSGGELPAAELLEVEEQEDRTGEAPAGRSEG